MFSNVSSAGSAAAGRRILAFACASLFCGSGGRAQEPPPQSQIDLLRREIDELKRRDAEKELKIQGLLGEVRSLKASQDAAAGDELERAVREVTASTETASAPSATTGAAAGPFRLIDISWDSLFAGGTSTATDAQLGRLQGGGHDPRKRGFTVQNNELSISGAVDPYFTAEAHVVFVVDPVEGETIVELEEAFATTSSLPFGLELEAGQFFTEFGRLNPRHPHQWEFLDQPVINSRLFGPDGLRGPGVRLGWLLPLDWFSELHLGVQNAAGETTESFLANEEVFDERPVGGRPFVESDAEILSDLLYLMRLDNGFDITDEIGMKVGLSALYGPNATGEGGDTWIYGADILFKWRPAANERGWPFVIWQTEFMNRDYRAARFFDAGAPLDPSDDIVLPGDDLGDWGLYTQVLWGFTPGWVLGLRYDYAAGDGAFFDAASGALVDRSADPFGDDRHRFSFLLSYLPTEFSRIRFQWNLDEAQHLDENQAHSFWLGLEILLGSHAAHTY